MRNPAGGKRRGRVTAVTLILPLGLAACASLGPHNDVLLFGTDTKFAVDVSADATSGGTPSVTVGYKRKEAVWMPLLANGGCHAESPLESCKTRGANGDRYVGSEGGASGKTDAYSVFASFGANLKGDAHTKASATVGLAQFFATGIAAQKLAANPQAANVLSVQPAETGKAIAEAGATLTEEEATARDKRKTIDDAHQKLASRAEACATLSSTGGAAIAAKLSGAQASDTRLKNELTKAKTAADFRGIITEFGEAGLDPALKAACAVS